MVPSVATLLLARGELPRIKRTATSDTQRRGQGDRKSKEHWSAEYKGGNLIAQF